MMIKFVCEKSVLASGISVASRAVAQKSTLQSIEGILFRAGFGTGLNLTGYNMETGITVQLDADVKENGQCVMPTKLLGDIVRRLPEGPVTICVDDEYKVSVQAGYASFTIIATSAEDYPDLPEVTYTNGVHIPQKELRQLISSTIFSVSENLSRPILTGCLFEVDDTSISAIAVDGFRLARRTYHPKKTTGRSFKFVAPAAALKEVEKILADTDEDAVFTLGPKHILFEIGGATLVCRILEGEFLDWRRVVPSDCPIKLVANVGDLCASIERVGLIVTEKVKSPVHCIFGDNVANFRTSTTNGAAADQCTLAGKGGDLEIGFNCRYLVEALRAVPSEECCLELTNGLSPIVLTPVREEDDFAYMILPIRLKNS